MFNAIKLQNVDQFRLYDPKSRIVFRANGDTGIIHGEVEINTVGPCVARLSLPAEGKAEPVQYLLGCYEGNVTIQFAIGAPLAAVVLEPSGEAWYRNAETFAVSDNPNPDENFTRLEKMGLEQDELGIALHRQAVLSRIQNERSQSVSDQYTRNLERQLAETNARVDAILAAQAEAEPEVEPA